MLGVIIWVEQELYWDLVNEYTVQSKFKYIGVPETFWVVTKPTKDSELVDILFESDIYGMHLQFAGGLKRQDIVAIVNDKSKAEKIAKGLLK